MFSNKRIAYVALFTECEQHKYLVEFPDLPGCYSQGDSLVEAVCFAQDALAAYYLEKDGDLPLASDFALIQQANPGVIAQMIVLNLKKSVRVVKKTLTVPDWLNTLAEKYQVNFSQILREALVDYLRKQDSLSACDKIFLEKT